MRQHRLISDLAAIEQQLKQLAQGPSLFTAEQASGTWAPAVDIYETAESFVLTAEVPGVKSSEVDVKVVDGTLVLRGERRWEHEDRGEHFHRLESAYGKFERTFSLSERIDVEGITAELARGVLKLVLPKKASQSTAKEIKVEAE
ncbi:MAG: Hsp20/alpha crystallin family protein [Acidobacteria bacterium]|nr:Hsp20/alpha crystallin family protein [Acidobacteriota bacterium]MBI3424318.1 Hsp20/alpha crystallin family protein [Acidobacteriota bacterium]